MIMYCIRLLYEVLYFYITIKNGKIYISNEFISVRLKTYEFDTKKGWYRKNFATLQLIHLN